MTSHARKTKPNMASMKKVDGNVAGDGKKQGRTQVGAQVPRSKFFLKLILYIYIYIYVCVCVCVCVCNCSPFKTFGFIQLATIQHKNFILRKKKNIHNGNCILAKKTILPPKNHVLLEKLKLIFFATIVN